MNNPIPKPQDTEEFRALAEATYNYYHRFGQIETYMALISMFETVQQVEEQPLANP